MTKGYDEKCAELAKHFLATDATEADVAKLAQRIQDAVEEYFWEEEHPLP